MTSFKQSSSIISLCLQYIKIVMLSGNSAILEYQTISSMFFENCISFEMLSCLLISSL